MPTCAGRDQMDDGLAQILVPLMESEASREAPPRMCRAPDRLELAS